MASQARCALLVGLLLLAAGCGGSKAPAVANLGTTTSSGAGGSANSASGLPPGGVEFGANMSISVGTGTAGVKYAACMRSHGLPSYPDPSGQGVITITVSAALNPSSPLFQKALTHCQNLIPAGRPPSAAQQQRLKHGVLAFAACMRSHGVPKYPDPTFGPGGTVSQGFSRRSIDPNSTIFQAAQKACQRAQTR